MSWHSPVIYSWLVALLAASACGQPAPQEQPAEEVDFIDTHQWGTWERVDDDTRIPSGLHSADSFEWAPDDRPIFFHTEEESERTRSEWEPFFEGRYLDQPNEKIAFQFTVQGHSPYDKHFQQLPQMTFGGRGGFVGFAHPLSGEYLHMFECSARGLMHFKIDDFVVRCGSWRSIDVFVIANPDAPPPPRMSPNDPGRGAPERLPPRWLAWFLETRQAESLAEEAHPTDFSKMKRLEVYAYSAPALRGIVTQRYVDASAHRRILGSGDYSWSLTADRIPADYCSDAGLETPICKP